MSGHRDLDGATNSSAIAAFTPKPFEVPTLLAEVRCVIELDRDRAYASFKMQTCLDSIDKHYI